MTSPKEKARASVDEDRIEYSEHLWITTGVDGDGQESSFMNATLQRAGELEFSVAVHVGVPLEAQQTEETLRDYLANVFGEAIFHTENVFGPATLNVEIQLGPACD